MLLLGAEQLACITSVLQVGQLVTNMIPQAMVPLINSRLKLKCEMSAGRDYHTIGRCFFFCSFQLKLS